MTKLGKQLELERCPHCNVDKPSLKNVWQFESTTHSGGDRRFWKGYVCARCGGLVTAAATAESAEATEMYPSGAEVDVSVPGVARDYLGQALNTLHAPAGSIMLSASAVDAMLKAKGYKEGTLYNRINQAAEDHLITEDMAKWAHEVRLDANEQRHADESIPLPTEGDAKKCVEFALALAQFLFVLPARVQRGLADAGKNT